MAWHRSIIICTCGAQSKVLDSRADTSWYVRRQRVCSDPKCEKTWSTAEVPLAMVKKLGKLQTFLAANGTMKISPAEMRRLAAVNEFINGLDSD